MPNFTPDKATLYTADLPAAADNKDLQNLKKFQENRHLSGDYIPEVEINRLPSGGHTYPKDFSIKYKVYSVGDLSYLNSSVFVDTTSKISYILRGITTSFPIMDLTLYDFIYVALLRKLSTFDDPTLSVKHVCNNDQCRETIEFTINMRTGLDFSEVFELDGLFDTEYNISIPEDQRKLPISLDIGNDKIMSFKPLTLQGYFDLYKSGKIAKASGKQYRHILMAKMCNNMEYEIAKAHIESLRGSYDTDLDLIFHMLHHGIKPVKNICSHCGFENSIVLDRNDFSGDVFIHPFRGHGETQLRKIRFGA